MAKKQAHAISPTRGEDYPEWYQQVVKAADLADTSPVRGCMVIKPWGYGIWERIQQALDLRFKDTGHQNAYFPLLIPKSFLEKEAQHVEGFAKECAVVTHHRLEAGPNGTLIPSGPLDEPLIIRPTSETIIGAMFAKWISSYRDLPILINQWANVVRWEMRTRVFLRTTEFLWQEGHTAHATSAEAMEETRQMLDIYADFAESNMALPVIKGEKTTRERFPGAVNTYCIEAMMQDRKALQAGTSHFLGQNFANAQDIRFQNEQGEHVLAWTTSWGVSTRLIGALIMTHSDDDGLILPPKMAPSQVVILPIYRTDEERQQVLAYCRDLLSQLKAVRYDDARVSAFIDDAGAGSAGGRAWEQIKRGVPIRLEVGPRDLANGTVFMGRRDLTPKEKRSVTCAELISTLPALLDEMQANLLQRARAFRDAATAEISNLSEFKAFFADDAPGGFAVCYAADNSSYEDTLDAFKVTPRCIPLDRAADTGPCIFTGAPNSPITVFARSY
jgi:prolyl-tRNA synthetase